MALLVASPLFRRSLAAEGYLLHRQSPEEPVLNILSSHGIGSISATKPLFVPLAQAELEDHAALQRCGHPRQLIPMLSEQIPEQTALHLKELRYHLAVQGKAPQALDYADYWLLDPAQMSMENRKAFVLELRREKRVSAVATGIGDWVCHDLALKDGFELFDGHFFYSPSPHLHESITPLKSNLIRLLNIVRNENYEFATVAGIVRQDPALTVSLMRFINSPFVGVRHRVRSIQQAVTLLGQIEVRKWVTTAVFKSMGTDRPSELTRISLLRAKFAENLAPLFRQEDLSDGLFLVGLFSVMDSILGVSMRQALELVPMADDLLNALLNRIGPYAPVLQFITDYEVANWGKVDQYCQAYHLQPPKVLQGYLDALAWYNDLIQSANATRGY